MFFKSIENLTAKEAKEIADNNKEAKERSDNKKKQYIEREVNKRYKKIIKKIIKESKNGSYYTFADIDFSSLYPIEINDCLIKLLKQKDFNILNADNIDGNCYIMISWGTTCFLRL